MKLWPSDLLSVLFYLVELVSLVNYLHILGMSGLASLMRWNGKDGVWKRCKTFICKSLNILALYEKMPDIAGCSFEALFFTDHKLKIQSELGKMMNFHNFLKWEYMGGCAVWKARLSATGKLILESVKLITDFTLDTLWLFSAAG